MTLLTKQEQEQVAAAISAVEQETDAEIVTVLTAQADNYAYIPLLWAGLIALVVPGIVNYFAGWLTADTLLLGQWGVFIVLSLIFRLPGINRRLIPAPCATGELRTWPGASFGTEPASHSGRHGHANFRF